MNPESLLSPHADQLEIVTGHDTDEVTLTLRGEIDLASAPALEREMRDAERSAVRRVVLDLAAVEFIDSTGVHLLLDAQARSQENGHELVLTHVPAHARRLFSLTGIDGRLGIEQDAHPGGPQRIADRRPIGCGARAVRRRRSGGDRGYTEGGAGRLPGE